MSFLMELVVNIVAEAAGEAAFRNRRRKYFPEGDANASLAAVAAFAGALALIFAVPVLLFVAYADQFTTTDRAGLLLAALSVAALGYGGRRAGVRAPQVTSRNPNLGEVRHLRCLACNGNGGSCRDRLHASVDRRHALTHPTELEFPSPSRTSNSESSPRYHMSLVRLRARLRSDSSGP